MSKKVTVKIEDSQIWCNVIEKVFEIPDNVTDVDNYLIENDFEGDCLVSEESIDFTPIETVDLNWEIVNEEDLGKVNEVEKVIVCPKCGKNGDETIISIGARIYGVLDKYGKIEWDTSHDEISDAGLHEIVCICQDECGTESDQLITDDEYKNNLSKE